MNGWRYAYAIYRRVDRPDERYMLRAHLPPEYDSAKLLDQSFYEARKWGWISVSCEVEVAPEVKEWVRLLEADLSVVLAKVGAMVMLGLLERESLHISEPEP